LIQAEDGDGEKIADEKNGSTKAKARVAKNTAMKIFNMPFCAYLGADFDDFLTVFDAGFYHAVQFDVGFYEFHCTISARGDGLLKRR